MPIDRIHPIIQAMLENVQAQQKNRALTENERSNKANEDARQAALDAQIKAHNDDYEHNKALLDNATKQLQSTLALHKTQRDKEIAEGFRTGAFKEQSVPGVIGMSQAPGVVDGLFPTGQYSNPAEASAQEAQAMEAKTKAQFGAMEPFKAADDARALKQQQFTRESAERVARMTRETQMDVAAINDQSRKDVAMIAARARLQAAAKHGVGVDDGVIDSYINDSYITGNTQEQQIPQKLRASIRENVPKGWTPLTAKDSEQIGGIGVVSDLIQSVRALGQAGQGWGRLSAMTGIGDAAEAQRTVDGLLGNIARIFGGEKGVLTQADVARAKQLSYSIRNRDKENAGAADKLEEFFRDKLGAVTSKYAPDQLKAIFGARGIDGGKWTPRGKETAPEDEIEVITRGADGKIVRGKK